MKIILPKFFDFSGLKHGGQYNGHGWGTVKYLDGGTNEGESSSRLSSLSRCLHEEFGVSGVEGCLSVDQNRDMYDDSSYDLCFGFNKKFVTPKKGYYESAISLTYNDRQLIINVSSCKENEIEKVNKFKEEYRAKIVMGIGDGNALIKQPSEIPKRFGLVKDKARSIKMSPVFENTLSKYNTDLLQVINAEKDSENTVVYNKSFKDRLKITDNRLQNNEINNFSILKENLNSTINRLKGYWFKGGTKRKLLETAVDEIEKKINNNNNQDSMLTSTSSMNELLTAKVVTVEDEKYGSKQLSLIDIICHSRNWNMDGKTSSLKELTENLEKEDINITLTPSAS